MSGPINIKGNLVPEPIGRAKTPEPLAEGQADRIKRGMTGAISMEEVKVKLRNLSEHLPNEDKILYEFARLLADRLNEKLVPEGFLLGAQLLLYDLERGIDGYTGQRINSRLVGYPPIIYVSIELMIPMIAEATCPADFAQEVHKIVEEIRNKTEQKLIK